MLGNNPDMVDMNGEGEFYSPFLTYQIYGILVGWYSILNVYSLWIYLNYVESVLNVGLEPRDQCWDRGWYGTRIQILILYTFS